MQRPTRPPRDPGDRSRLWDPPFRRRLVQRAQGILGSREDAEEAVQDAYLALLDEGEHSVRSPSGWLGTVVRHRAWKILARRRRYQTIEPGQDERWVEPVDKALAREELGEVVRRHVHELPEPYRDVLRMHLLEGQDLASIARLTGVNPSTVRSQAQRGYQMLKERLGIYPESTWRTLLLLPLLLWPRRGGSPAAAAWVAAATTVVASLAVWVALSDSAPERAERSVLAETEVTQERSRLPETTALPVDRLRTNQSIPAETPPPALRPLEIRVIWHQGRAASAFEVVAQKEGAEPVSLGTFQGETRPGKLDQQVRVAAPTPCRISVRSAEAPTGPALWVTEEETSLRIHLQRTGRLYGRVTNPAGAGIAGAEIHFRPLARDPVLFGGPEASSPGQKTRTGPEGSFSLAKLALDLFEVSVRLPDGTGAMFVHEHDWKQGASEEGLLFEVQAPVRIRGTLGSGYHLRAYPADPWKTQQEVTAAADGSFEFATLDPGELRILAVSLQGDCARALEWKGTGASGDLVDLEADDFRTVPFVAGRLVAQGLEDRFDPYLLPETGSNSDPLVGITDGRGAFLVPSSEAESYTLTLRSRTDDRVEFYREEGIVADHGWRWITLDPYRSSVAGTLTARPPGSEFEIALVGSDASKTFRLPLGPSGQFRFERVPQGTYALVASSKKRGRTVLSRIELGDYEDLVLGSLSLPKTGKLKVLVHPTFQGAPLNSLCSLRQEDWELQQATRSFRYPSVYGPEPRTIRFEELLPGTYEFTHLRGFESVPKRVEIRPGVQSILELEPRPTLQIVLNLSSELRLGPEETIELYRVEDDRETRLIQFGSSLNLRGPGKLGQFPWRVPAGEHTFRVRTSLGREFESTLWLEEGPEVLEVDLVIDSLSSRTD